jgi:hypothetical protein
LPVVLQPYAAGADGDAPAPKLDWLQSRTAPVAFIALTLRRTAMSKSQPNKTAPDAKDVQQAAAKNDELEQEQVRHRTALRIAGIEGVDGFADVAEKAEASSAS